MSAAHSLPPPTPPPPPSWTPIHPLEQRNAYRRPLTQQLLWHAESPEVSHRAIGQPTADSGQVVFTRQLWRRKMPGNGDKFEPFRVLEASQSASNASDGTIQAPPACDRRISSGTSLSGRSQPHSPDPSQAGSRTPLTPEESPPFTTTTRKRSAAFVTDPDKADDQPTRARGDLPDIPPRPCICKSDPKIPRPRNAFILYRQAKQARVVAEHPGLANPKISKIIGELWQKEPPGVKDEWKRLAEEEKVRHQQQYPSYRYQPKRNTSRNSQQLDGSESLLEAGNCTKCGGGTAFRSSTPYTVGQFHSSASDPTLPPTAPASAGLPGFGNLSVDSPRNQRMGRPTAGPASMSYPQQHQPSPHDRRGDSGPLSPESKRRRFNSEQPATAVRPMPPRFAGVVGPVPVTQGPATPFPFHPQAGHAWGPAMHGRRDSLPAMQRMSPPGAMQPPPQPVIGYQQHRLSQGHLPQDRSLVLPPLKTGHASVAPAPAAANANGKDPSAAAPARTPGQKPLEFRTKIKVLSQVAHPAPRSSRGPLIAIEGDDEETVRSLGAWLRETLDRSHDDLTVRQLFEPKVDVGEGSKEEVMMRYHQLVGEWLLKSQTVVEGLALRKVPPSATSAEDADVRMGDTSATTARAPTETPLSSRKLDERYDDESEGEDTLAKGDGRVERRRGSKTATRRSFGEKAKDDGANRKGVKDSSNLDEDMEMEPPSASSALASTTLSPTKAPAAVSAGATPVTIITNFSLHASNAVARRIPIGGLDPYAPNDHWQWTATQWRGIVGPDLTIYVLDEREPSAGGSGVTMETVDTRPDVGLFVLARSPRADGGVLELEAHVLRRLSFEVAEWVRLFMSGKKGSPGSSGKA